MSLVSEAPRIPLFRGMCVRIPLFFLVLGGRGSRNNGRIHNRSFFQDPSALAQSLYHHGEELLADVVFDQQMFEKFTFVLFSLQYIFFLF